jgi:hypothetical protein
VGRGRPHLLSLLLIIRGEPSLVGRGRPHLLSLLLVIRGEPCLVGRADPAHHVLELDEVDAPRSVRVEQLEDLPPPALGFPATAPPPWE